MLIKNDEELQQAQTWISEFMKRNTPSHAPLLEIAVNEAMNNGYHSSGRIELKLKCMGRKLIIRVKDDGPGFSTEEVNVQLEKNIYEEKFEKILESEGGRGILLMKLFCDKVIYNAKGNEVLLMKKIR